MKSRLISAPALLLTAVLFAYGCGTSTVVHTQNPPPDPLAGSLEKVSADQIAAFNREDVAATMSYAHTRSPTYEAAKESLTEYFENQDLKAEQVSFQYIGHDDEFAYARVRVKVSSPGAEGFETNVTDTVTIFHQEGGSWKVWDAYVFGATLVK